VCVRASGCETRALHFGGSGLERRVPLSNWLRGVTAILYRGVVMMSKLLVLALVAVCLTACGSTREIADVSGPAAQDVARPRIVVRGAVVPDDPAPQVAPARKSSVAHASAVSPTSTAPKPAKKPSNAGAGSPKPAPAATTLADGAVSPAVEVPPTVAVPLVETPAPATTVSESKPAKPNRMSTDIPAIIQSVVGGMPIWLMVLIGVVLLAAIALGMSGGRKTGEA
jgi:hypothetical protein